MLIISEGEPVLATTSEGWLAIGLLLLGPVKLRGSGALDVASGSACPVLVCEPASAPALPLVSKKTSLSKRQNITSQSLDAV